MELEEAIEILKEFKKTGYHTLMAKYNWDRIKANTMIEIAIETLVNHLTKHEKMIDEMIKVMSDRNICKYFIENYCKHYAGENKKTCDVCIKQYFEKKANEEDNSNVKD